MPFNQIFVKLAGNEDRHKISDEFKFGPGWTFQCGVIHPCAFPLTLNGENGVSIFSQLLQIQSSSNLQVTRAGIKARTSPNFGHTLLVILELDALERWKKWCLQLFSVTFDWIFVKLADNEDRRKSSNKFEFGPDRIIHFGVIHPWVQIFFPHRLILGQRWNNRFFRNYCHLWFETSNRWPKWQEVSVDIKTLSPVGCMPASCLGAIYMY